MLNSSGQLFFAFSMLMRTEWPSGCIQFLVGLYADNQFLVHVGAQFGARFNE